MSREKRSVILRLPSGALHRITRSAARMLQRRGHARFSCWDPPTVELHWWALGIYRRFFRWSTGPPQCQGALIMRALEVAPHCSLSGMRTDFDPPERWQERRLSSDGRDKNKSC